MANIFKRRKTELGTIYGFRLTFLILSSILIVGYLAIQIQDITNEAPSIRVRLNESVSLPIPAILVSASIDKQLDQICTLRDENEKTLIGNNKTGDFTEATEYCGSLIHKIRTNDMNAMLILPGETQSSFSGTSAIKFTVSSDETEPQNVIYVSVYDQTLAPSKEDLKILENFDAKFIASLNNLNKYTLTKSHNLIFKVSRRLQRAIKPSLLNNLGIPPQLEDEYYITSNSQSRYVPDMGNYAYFEVYYQNYLTIVEEQFRVKTVFNLLGLLGGAISLMLTTHSLLFGSMPNSPWGIIDQLPCVPKLANDKP